MPRAVWRLGSIRSLCRSDATRRPTRLFFVVGFHVFVVGFHLPQGVEQRLHAFQFGSKCEPRISQSAKLLPIMIVRRRFGQSLAVQRMFAALFRVARHGQSDTSQGWREVTRKKPLNPLDAILQRARFWEGAPPADEDGQRKLGGVLINCIQKRTFVSALSMSALCQ